MPFNSSFYPIPNATDTRDLLSVFQFVSNQSTEGFFFPIMIAVIWVVQFIGIISEGKPASRAWIYASFVSTILAIILGILAMLQQKWVYLLVIFVSIGVFWLKLAQAKE